MPTYAILGATGSTGQELLKQLLQSPDNKVNAYVRSRSKLERLSPELISREHVEIFEGALTDIPLLGSCLTSTNAVFCVLGTNVSYPGCRVVEDAAHSLVAALCHLRAQDPSTRLPKITFLTSAGVNPRFNRANNPIAMGILHTALSYAYEDLERAQEFLKLHRSWLNVTFIQPGGLAYDSLKGHTLSTEATKGFIGYADLAAGMIEVVGKQGGELNWKGVAVVPASDDVKFNWEAPRNLIRGLLAHYLPAAYWGLKRVGAVL